MREEILKEISINSDNDNLIWTVDPAGRKLAPTIKLTVGSGCMAIALINGQIARTYFAGTYAIDWRKEEKKGNRIKVVGVNMQKEFVLKFGIGGIQFNDKQVKLSPLVGTHGECICTVSDGEAIYKAFGAKAVAVTPDDISKKLYMMFVQDLTSEFAKILEEYDYFNIAQSTTRLANKIKEKYAGELAKNGITLKSCKVDKPFFPDGYNEQRQQAGLKIESDKNADMQRLQDINLIRELSKNAAAQPNQGEKKKCPRCGCQNDNGVLYCCNCGKKL